MFCCNALYLNMANGIKHVLFNLEQNFYNLCPTRCKMNIEDFEFKKKTTQGEIYTVHMIPILCVLIYPCIYAKLAYFAF